ncbi:MAG: universal stress protein [Deltaproteobacteria bacterium]|jgi:nucleotide-binding universal stress UspA family protein|nr:MAG: universal stress protein [Deltaproteobacteria bacterium]
MLEKVLYPTDFSDASKKALDYIKQLKQAGIKEVVVLHVIDEREIDAIFQHSAVRFEDIVRSIRAEAKKEMGAVERELGKNGFTVKVRIERGIPFQIILAVEEEEDVSAIVIGSHGKTNIKEMLLGSVSEKVIRKSKKPVLVVKR